MAGRAGVGQPGEVDRDADVRGRTVVWDSGASRVPAVVVRRRRRLNRLVTALVALVAAAGLGVAVGVSVLPGRLGRQPETPLWQATQPAAAVTESARPSPTSSPSPSPSPSSSDDHGGRSGRGRHGHDG